MEIIIGIIFVLVVAVVFFSRKPKELVQAEQAEVAPYKVEEVATPAPVVEEVKVEEVPAKKPRAPRKPKAETAKKPAAKKTAGRKPKAK
jgi:hypothetical protein